ncbi:MAG: SpoIIE family protein phosphatase [Prevotella sp.]|nr:SpoIIE family protein phosphatase [Prevotella sp.]
MKRIIAYIRRRLSVKLSLWVVLFAAVIFNAALAFFVWQAREAVHQEAISRATQILDKTSLRVEGILNRVEVATQMTEWLVQRHPDKADSMFVYSRGMLLNNPDFYNCSIAFEPYYFKDKGRYFSAYSMMSGDSIRTIQGGSDHYQYFYMDWYLMPTLMGRPCWTEPYMDFDAPTNSYAMVTSYCQAIKDKAGRAIGVINTSLSLNWLSKTISETKPYPNSYSIMIGRGGTYFVHPDTTKITRQTIFTQTIDNPDTALTALGHAMQRGEEGMKRMDIDGTDCYVFYKPLGQTGCSMAIVCPESDIFGGFNRLRHIVWGIITVGLLLMLFFFIRIITRELRPLQQLAKETETIASGQFDAQIPDFHRTDEIGQLSHSFAGMQQSLVRYIEQLKDTTAQKASIESELNIARSIQMSMLPKTFPPFPDCDEVSIYGQLAPAKAVGGDLYDFYIRDQKMFFCIGDVSGKGIPASLVMAVTRALFRTISAHEERPERIVSQLSNTIAEDNEQGMFVTLFVGIIDLDTGHMAYCNAGHNPPLLISGKGNRVGLLPVDSNIPAGVMSGWEYTPQDTTIDSGTTIFLYTDGLNEAENSTHGQFGDERMMETAQAVCADGRPSPQALVDKMVAAVHAFVGDAEQSDDLTMMAIQYSPKAAADGQRRHSVTLPNDVDTVPQLPQFINAVAEDAALDASQTMSLNLAIEEAVVNVMQYAYPEGTKGTVNIVATIADGLLTFVISDSGKPFDPTAKADVDTTLPAEERPIGGLGIHLVRQMMDDITYERKGNKNILTLRKSLRP